MYKSGAVFENMLNKIFRKYAECGYAHIIKLEGLKVKGSEAYKQKLPFDFLGWVNILDKEILPTAKPIGVEAKNVLKGGKLPKSYLKKHQITNLLKLNEDNGLAYLVVGFGDLSKILRISVNDRFNALYLSKMGLSYQNLYNLPNTKEFDFKNPDILSTGVIWKSPE